MITCDNLWFGVDTHIIDGDNDYDRTIFYSVSSDRDDDFDEWDYHYIKSTYLKIYCVSWSFLISSLTQMLFFFKKKSQGFDNFDGIGVMITNIIQYHRMLSTRYHFLCMYIHHNHCTKYNFHPIHQPGVLLLSLSYSHLNGFVQET